MTFLDIFIIYLAFGAPIAVYKYLQNRDALTMRRWLSAVATFLFWIPAAVSLGRLYISNAYLGDAFVSPVDSDSSEILISELRESLRSDLVRLGAGVGMHDARETVDRYVGLASAVRKDAPLGGTAHENLFEAAGREDFGLGVRCINIRNRRRLERHHTQSRKELLKLFAEAPDSSESSTALKTALRLARQLGDFEMFDRLRELTANKAVVWNSESKHKTQSINIAPVIAPTGSLNGE
jgi:hypothetical protein